MLLVVLVGKNFSVVRLNFSVVISFEGVMMFGS